MCGITGYIGKSKNKELSFRLLTSLFKFSEARGIDASGFWAVERGASGGVIYQKEPIRSSKFIKSKFWLNFSEADSDLVIAHARGASKGVGEPFFNENNHPFTSTDKSIGLAHNGRIDDKEYNEIKNEYEVSTSCDSEILLRIFEANAIKYKNELEAIKEIFSLINDGHMAVSIGKRCEEGKRVLWLFRNEYRPLWISDLRDELGQIFFISEPSIWEDACIECNSKKITACYKLVEINPQEIWQIESFGGEIRSERYKVEKEEVFQKISSSYFPIPKNKSNFNVKTNLDENDQIIRQNCLWNEINIKDLENQISNITDKCEAIETELKYMTSEGIVDKEYFYKVLHSLKLQEEGLAKILALLYN